MDLFLTPLALSAALFAENRIGSEIVAFSLEQIQDRYSLQCEATAPKIRCLAPRPAQRACSLTQKVTCVSPEPENPDTRANTKQFKAQFKIKYFSRPKDQGTYRLQNILVKTQGPAPTDELFGEELVTQSENFVQRSGYICEKNSRWWPGNGIAWKRMNCRIPARDPFKVRQGIKIRMLKHKRSILGLNFRFYEK